MGDLHSASVAEKVVKKHAQRRHCDMKEKINTQSREDTSAPFVIDKGASVLSAWVAEERNRVLGKELTEVGE